MDQTPVRKQQDTDSQETAEWLSALDDVLQAHGSNRAVYLMEQLNRRLLEVSGQLSGTLTTPYRNTIPPAREARMPGDLFMDRKIRSIIRWNALAMVSRANLNHDELGGHISSFSSSATLYDVGFNYFFRAPTDTFAGDLIYFQGHSAPGIYARAYLEGRLDEAQLDHFRREVDGNGLSSYPHPWLMPDFWQFPDSLYGARLDPGDLPSPFHEIHGRPRARPHAGSQSLDPSSVMASAMNPSRLVRSRWQAASSLIISFLL